MQIRCSVDQDHMHITIIYFVTKFYALNLVCSIAKSLNHALFVNANGYGIWFP